jgi:hypothetical protein
VALLCSNTLVLTGMSPPVMHGPAKVVAKQPPETHLTAGCIHQYVGFIGVCMARLLRQLPQLGNHLLQAVCCSQELLPAHPQQHHTKGVQNSVEEESRKWCGHSCWPMYHDANNTNTNTNTSVGGLIGSQQQEQNGLTHSTRRMTWSPASTGNNGVAKQTTCMSGRQAINRETSSLHLQLPPKPPHTHL